MSKELALNSSKRFKFQSLNSQLFQIKTKKFQIQKDSENSFFIEFYENEKELNLTARFQSLKFNYLSLEQVLYHKHDIVRDLLECAGQDTVVSVCKLLSYLITDLESELYPQMDSIFSKLIELLTETRPAEEVKSIFMFIKHAFKHLSAGLLGNITHTWSFVESLLSIQNIHIQRLTAENFGLLVRKSKFDRQLLEMILKSADEKKFIGVAMVFYESIRLVDHSFHSKAGELITTLFDIIFKDISSPKDLCLEKILVLVGHYGNPEGLEGIIAAIMKYNIHFGQQGYEIYAKIVFMVIGLRKGARLKNYEIVLDALQNCLQSEFGVRGLDAFLKYSPGEWKERAKKLIKILEGGDLKLLIKFYEINGFHPPSIQVLKKKWIDGDDQSRELITKFLGRLPISEMKDEYLQSQLLLQIKNWAIETDNMQVLVDRIRACGHFKVDYEQYSSAVMAQIKTVRALTGELAKGVVGVLLEYLATNALNNGNAPRLEAFLDVLITMVEEFSSSTGFMKGAAQFVTVLGRDVCNIGIFRKIYAVVEPNLGSFDSSLRQETLKFLNGFSQEKFVDKSESHFHGVCNILQICLDLELTPNSHEMEREKGIYLRKLEAIVKSGALPQLYIKGLSLYVIALMSVNFAPLWAYAASTLQVIYQSYPKTFVPVLMETIIYLSKDRDLPPALVEEIQEEEAIKETNKRDLSAISLECTNLQTLDQQWRKIGEVYSTSTHFENEILQNMDSVDLVHWYTMLVKFLGGVPSLILDQSKILVPLFQKLFEYDLEEDTNNKQAKSKVLSFLHSFAKVTKPRKLSGSEELFNTYLHLLTNGDSRVQNAALECIFTWQYEGIVKYNDNLKSLADDDRLRESLAVLDMSQVRTTMLKEDLSIFVKIVIRILYGKLVTKHNRNSKAIVKSRRMAVFSFMGTLNDMERNEMVELMLEPFKGLLIESIDEEFKVAEGLSCITLAPLKKQIGFLNVVEDFIKQLRTMILPCMPKLLETIIYLLHYSEKLVENSVDTDSYVISQARQVRNFSIKRLTLIFSLDVDFDFSPYVSQIFTSFIDSRIPRLYKENTQAPSGLLDLLAAWSKDRRYLTYLVRNSDMMTAVISLLSAKKVQESVVIHVLAIIESIQDMHDEFPEERFLPRMLQVEIPILLQNCKHILDSSIQESHIKFSPQSIPNRIIRVLSRISIFVKESDIAETLLSILVPFLKSSPKAVPEMTKAEILRILKHFMPILPNFRQVHPSESLYYPIICQLFSTLETQAARQELLQVFAVIADSSPDLELVSQHLFDLNSMSTKRIDEPDFDRRFSAYSKLNQTDYLMMNVVQWRPLLYNHFFYVADQLEYSIRTSAAFGITRFIEQSISKADLEGDLFFSTIQHIVLPQIKKGLKVTDDVVRFEWIKLWGALVSGHPEKQMFADMVCLLGVDEENNFFANITHIQVHRRVKALRAIVENISKISPSNVTHLISLLTHFVYNSDKNSEHNIINESMNSIAACCSALAWGQYYATIKRFLNSMKFRPELEKVLVRLVVLILDKYHFSSSAVVDVNSLDADETIEEEVDALMEVKQILPVANLQVRIAVTTKLLPNLEKLLAVKDDETLATRTPLAIAIVKLLQQIDGEAMRTHLPKVLITLCNFLSSHLQSSRDCARATLVTISVMLGSEYLPFILSAMKTALTRGYQLHVLGYTLHAIFLENVNSYKSGSIDSCVGTVVEIAMQDIFGETGKEREVQELRGKMREIKLTKSFETIELLCKVITFSMIQNIIVPLKLQMVESRDIKVVKKIEDVFRRMAVGINSNSSVDMVDFMVFVFKLLSESLPLTQDTSKKVEKLTEAEKRAEVVLKRADALEVRKYYDSNIHMFVEFGLSLLLTSLKRERISFKDQKHLEMLDPLVPHIGRALYSKHASISVIAIRIICVIVKLPLPELEDSVPVFVKKAFQMISKSASTDSELMQSLFKFLAIVLRDMKHIQVPEKQVVALLAFLTPDLESPERQATTFALIRAILERKYVTNEIYDLMDRVSEILVTNQSSQVRELCRNCYIQFLMNYPHGNVRLRKQMTKLVSNLDYEFESGRSSVLELFNICLAKFSDELFQEYCDMILLALVMVLSNDDSTKCKEMASVLIKGFFTRLDINRMPERIDLIQKWFSSGVAELQHVSCQVIGLAVDAFGERGHRWTGLWMKILSTALQSCHSQWRDNSDWENLNWELGYFALETCMKIIKFFPKTCIIENSDIWILISNLLLYPHQSVRLASLKLLNSLFSHIDAPSRRLVGKVVDSDVPLPDAKPFAILSNERDLCKLSKRMINQLDSENVDSDFAKNIVKGLFYISKCLCPLSKTVSEDVLEDEVNPEDEEGSNGNGLLWVTKRLCYLARIDSTKKRGIILRSSVFQWIAAIFKFIPVHERQPYLQIMIKTLYLTEKDDTFRGEEADKLKLLATEALSLLQKECGTTEYLETYQSVHESIVNQRRERKRQRAVQAITDPKLAAQIKQKKSMQKVNARKRKAQEFAIKKRMKI